MIDLPIADRGSARTATVPLGLPVPVPDCPHCGGSGYVTEHGNLYECRCLLRAKARLYLTAEYVGAATRSNFNPRPLLNHNVLIQNRQGRAPREFSGSYRSTVKSFLLSTGCRLSHRTLSAYLLVQAHINNSEHGRFDLMLDLDLLVLYLAADPPNKLYPSLLPYTLDQRSAQAKPTWVVTPYTIDNAVFQNLYGDSLGASLKAHGFLDLNK